MLVDEVPEGKRTLDISGTPGPTKIAVVNTRFTNNVKIDGPTSTGYRPVAASATINASINSSE